MQSDMLSAFDEIKAVGVKTLNMESELEKSCQSPGSPVEDTASLLMRNKKQVHKKRNEVTQQNVL